MQLQQIAVAGATEQRCTCNASKMLRYEGALLLNISLFHKWRSTEKPTPENSFLVPSCFHIKSFIVACYVCTNMRFAKQVSRFVAWIWFCCSADFGCLNWKTIHPITSFNAASEPDFRGNFLSKSKINSVSEDSAWVASTRANTMSNNAKRWSSRRRWWLPRQSERGCATTIMTLLSPLMASIKEASAA